MGSIWMQNVMLENDIESRERSVEYVLADAVGCVLFEEILGAVLVGSKNVHL